MKQSEVATILKEVRASFTAQLNEVNRVRPGAFTKARKESLEAGCSDGSRMLLFLLRDKGHITIEED